MLSELQSGTLKTSTKSNSSSSKFALNFKNQQTLTFQNYTNFGQVLSRQYKHYSSCWLLKL